MSSYPGAAPADLPPAAARRWLVLLAFGVLLVRAVFVPHVYAELDCAVYLRAASDFARHLRAGDFWRLPWTDPPYTAVEYWPPLYPLLSGALAATLGCGVEEAARAVSFGAGMLCLFPIYALGSALWSRRAGLMAAAFVGFHPMLAWLSWVPRSDVLYVFLILLGTALALRPFPLTAAAAGACFGAASMTRFETPLALIAALAAMVALARRGDAAARRRAAVRALLLAGVYLAVAAPYFLYLGRLNGRFLALSPPQKMLYDSLEGVWTGLQGRPMGGFQVHCGLPGMVRINSHDPWVQAALRQSQGVRNLRLMAYGLVNLPANLRCLFANWFPPLLLLAALAVRREGRDARTRAMLLLGLPALILPFVVSWDPSPRYYAFTIVPLALLAGRAAEGLWTGGWEASATWRHLLFPLAIFAGWYEPVNAHFDVPHSASPFFRYALPHPEAVVLTMAVLGALAGYLLLGMRLRRWLVGAAVAVLGMELLGDLMLLAPTPPGGWLAGSGVVLSLAALALLMGICCACAPRRARAVVLAVVGWSAVLVAQNLAAMRAADRRFMAANSSEAVQAWIQRHSGERRVASNDPIDVVRGGAQWEPLEANGRPTAGSPAGAVVFRLESDGADPVPVSGGARLLDEVSGPDGRYQVRWYWIPWPGAAPGS